LPNVYDYQKLFHECTRLHSAIRIVERVFGSVNEKSEKNEKGGSRALSQPALPPSATTLSLGANEARRRQAASRQSAAP
jgi:hypothetical protein